LNFATKFIGDGLSVADEDDLAHLEISVEVMSVLSLSLSPASQPGYDFVDIVLDF